MAFIACELIWLQLLLYDLTVSSFSSTHCIVIIIMSCILLLIQFIFK